MPATSVANAPKEDAYRIPDGVEFLHWDGGDEWVVYHSGTGETLRLSDGAVTILELLKNSRVLSRATLAQAIFEIMVEPAAIETVAEATDNLVNVLLQHECIEPVPCG